MISLSRNETVVDVTKEQLEMLKSSIPEKSIVAIGDNVSTDEYAQNTVVIGYNTEAEFAGAVVIGSSAKGSESAIAIGAGAKANGLHSIAIGGTTAINADNSIQIGSGTNDVPNSARIGSATILKDGKIPLESLNGISPSNDGKKVLNNKGQFIEVQSDEITIDTELSVESENAIANSAVATALNEMTDNFNDELEKKQNTLTIDTELSTESENPVQNKIITAAFNRIDQQFDLIDEKIKENWRLITDVTLEENVSMFNINVLDENGEPSRLKKAIIKCTLPANTGTSHLNLLREPDYSTGTICAGVWAISNKAQIVYFEVDCSSNFMAVAHSYVMAANNPTSAVTANVNTRVKYLDQITLMAATGNIQLLSGSKIQIWGC